MEKSIFKKSMEKAICGVFVSYNDGIPLWIKEWSERPLAQFSDVFEMEGLKLKNQSHAFISCKKGEINYFSAVRKDKDVATKKTKLVFLKTVKFSDPISIDKLLDRCDLEMKESFERLLKSNFSTLTANNWNAIIHIISNEQRSDFENIMEKIDKTKTNNTRSIRSEERDAIGLALKLAGFYDKAPKINEWKEDESLTPDFLRNISEAKIREDQMIYNDFSFFDDWKLVKEFKNNTCVFSDEKNHVSIMYANRTPIENTLGVDLFYLNNLHQNYIFVQYKRLLNRGKSFSYNLKSDRSFDEELNRMSKVEGIVSELRSRDSTLKSYRFNPEMFYFKFCNEIQELYPKGLVKGMYLPKSYILKILKEPGVKSISFENTPRYFNNTMFIEMVKSGMFGSSEIESNKITKMLDEIINSGRSIIIASKTPNN